MSAFEQRDVNPYKDSPHDIPVGCDLELFGLCADTTLTLLDHGVKYLFAIQKATFRPIAAGHNVIGKDRTGSGKTMAFMLPILEKIRKLGLFRRRAAQLPLKLVLVPTRELALQVSGEYEKLRNLPGEFRTVAAYGGDDIDLQAQRLAAGAEIVVGTPGRLLDLLDGGLLGLEALRVLVLDEMDEMLRLGFLLHIERIVCCAKGANRSVDQLQYLLFSATVSARVKHICTSLLSEQFLLIDLVRQKDVQTPKSVQHLCLKIESAAEIASLLPRLILLQGGSSARSIIFVDFRDRCKEVFDVLRLSQRCGVLSADAVQAERDSVFSHFRERRLQCLICTNVSARGLDFPGVDLVIQLAPPSHAERYIHRCGRVGRAGNAGKSVVIYQPSQTWQLQQLERHANIKFAEISMPAGESVKVPEPSREAGQHVDNSKSADGTNQMAEGLARIRRRVSQHARSGDGLP